MRVLVTGGAGFIGSHVCDALLARGDEVFCIDNFNDYYVEQRGSRFAQRKLQNLFSALQHRRFVPLGRNHPQRGFPQVDITDIEQLREYFPEGVDAVVHLAALAGVRASKKQPELYHRTNVDGTWSVIKIGAAHGVKRFVLASSSSVYAGSREVPFSEAAELASPPNPYARSKQDMERVVARMADILPQISVANLRFFSVYGPRGRADMAPHLIMDSIYRGDEFRKIGDGTAERDWTYVSDIVRGVISAIGAYLPNRVEAINLGNQTPISLNTLIELEETYAQKKANILQVPEDSSEMRVTCADASKARKLLDWEATTSLEDGLAKFHAWYLEHELR